jgi:hypothetical protein
VKEAEFLLGKTRNVRLLVQLLFFQMLKKG